MKSNKKLVVLYTRINGVERVQVSPELVAKDKKECGGTVATGYRENREYHEAWGLRTEGVK